jgi:hypothetical protein
MFKIGDKAIYTLKKNRIKNEPYEEKIPVQVLDCRRVKGYDEYLVKVKSIKKWVRNLRK